MEVAHTVVKEIIGMLASERGKAEADVSRGYLHPDCVHAYDAMMGMISERYDL